MGDGPQGSNLRKTSQQTVGKVNQKLLLAHNVCVIDILDRLPTYGYALPLANCQLSFIPPCKPIYISDRIQFKKPVKWPAKIGK